MNLKKNLDNIQILNSGNSSFESNFWLIIIKINSKVDLTKKFKNFSEKNFFETRSVWKLLYLQNHLRKYNSSQCKKSKEFIKNCFCLPSGLDLTQSDIKNISYKIKLFLKKIK